MAEGVVLVKFGNKKDELHCKIELIIISCHVPLSVPIQLAPPLTFALPPFTRRPGSLGNGNERAESGGKLNGG